MFLKEIKRIYKGYSPKDSYTVNVYSGISKADFNLMVFWIRSPQDGRIVLKELTAKNGADEEQFMISQVKYAYPEWVEHDYTQFDSPLQAEEAAQVRGMLIDDPAALAAVTGLIRQYEVANKPT